MRGKAKFYLGERHNPQLSKVYYMKLGQKSKKDAEKYTKGYGTVYLESFDTEEEYNNAIANKQAQGYKCV